MTSSADGKWVIQGGSVRVINCRRQWWRLQRLTETEVRCCLAELCECSMSASRRRGTRVYCWCPRTRRTLPLQTSQSTPNNTPTHCTGCTFIVSLISSNLHRFHTAAESHNSSRHTLEFTALSVFGPPSTCIQYLAKHFSRVQNRHAGIDMNERV